MLSDDEDVIQDNLQAETIGAYYDGVNERKRRASIEMEASFANELQMFRRQDAALSVQCGWRCYKARTELGQRRAWAKVAVAGKFLGELALRFVRMKEHRVAFHLHRRRVAASVVLQRYARGRSSRKVYNGLVAAKRAREHEAYRKQLHEQAAHAVHTLNHHYSIVEIEQIAIAKEGSNTDVDGPWDPNSAPALDLEPEMRIEDTRPPTPGSPDDQSGKPMSSPLVKRRKKKGGRPAGLCTGRARQRAGSVEATMAFEGVPEAQRTALVVRPNAFRAAGQKVQTMIKVSNIFAAGPLVRSGTAGSEAQVEADEAQTALTPRAKPLKKGRKLRAPKSSSARSYANTKPRYLQHLEPKPPRPAITSARRPGSDRAKLPPLPKTATLPGEVRAPAASAVLVQTPRGQPKQLSPLRVKAR